MPCPQVANVYNYFLVLTIGMGMDITAIARNPGIFLVGGLWMFIHATTMIIFAFALKAPLFFFCVGSQANIGGTCCVVGAHLDALSFLSPFRRVLICTPELLTEKLTTAFTQPHRFNLLSLYADIILRTIYRTMS